MDSVLWIIVEQWDWWAGIVILNREKCYSLLYWLTASTYTQPKTIAGSLQGLFFLGQSDFVDAIKHFLCQREHSAFYSAHRFGIVYFCESNLLYLWHTPPPTPLAKRRGILLNNSFHIRATVSFRILLFLWYSLLNQELFKTINNSPNY